MAVTISQKSTGKSWSSTGQKRDADSKASGYSETKTADGVREQWSSGKVTISRTVKPAAATQAASATTGAAGGVGKSTARSGAKKAAPASPNSGERVSASSSGSPWTRTETVAVGAGRGGGRQIYTEVQRPTLLGRVKDTVSGGIKGAAASNANAVSTLYAMGQGFRDTQNREALEEYSRNLEQAKRGMETMMAENREKPGSWDARDIQSQQYIIDDWQRKYDAMDKVLNGQVQQKATQASYELADDVQRSSAQDIERAKEGLGSVGRVLVDAGASMTQTALDAAASGLLGAPGGMGAFAMRAFGGGTQQARQDNPNSTLGQQVLYGAASAAKEVFTEKMFNIAMPFAKAYGGGTLDGMVERGIRSAVDRFAKTDVGKRVLGGALTFGAGAVGEGLEEFIGDWMEWQMPRIYGGDAASAGETLENSLYDFLVGAASGMMGSAVTPSTYHYDTGDASVSDQLIRAGATQEEAARLAPAVEAVLNGQQIGSNQAGAIVRSKAAISTLETATGKTINTDAPLSEVKKAVKALAARQEAPTEQVAVDTAAAQAAPAEAQRVSADARTGSFSDRVGDRTTVEDFARDMDRAGASVLTSMYADGQDVERYLGGMMKAYHAGLNGNEPVSSAVLQRYDVNRAQAEAAYMAGQADAAASLAKERRAAQFAKTAGTDSGLVYDEYVANKMDSAAADEMNTVSKALGVRVRMVDGTQVLGGQANGQITGSDILIAKDAQDPVLRVVGHEWTHRVQELAPEQYRTFRNAVGSLPDVQGAAQILLKQYRAAGVEIGYEQALDEAAANYAGDMIGNSGVLDDFIRKNRANRTLLEKLRDAIHEIVGKLTGRARQQAQTVEGKLQAAFEAAGKQAESLNNKNTATEGGETRYSFAGEKAKNADLEALRTAQEMEKDGADTETIRQKTGWFRGADGKWRWEIDGSGMEYRRDGDAQLLNEPEYRRLQELTDKWAKSFEENGPPLSASEEAEMAELQETYSDRVWDGKYLLRDFLKHDELFKEYPYLNRVSLVFDELGYGEKGFFDKRSNTIVLSDSLIGKAEDTLIHEIQHVIQKIEGFASGSSPKYWNERMENGYSKRWASGEEMMPSELYRNTAGEIEARDTAARRSLTVEERKNRKPNTGDENTVFADSGTSYELVGKNKDGIEVYETGENIKKMSYRERMEAFLNIMRNEYAGRTAKFNDGNNTYYAKQG